MDFLKKAMLLGLGAVALTREKAEELVDELVKLGQVTKEEKSKMVNDMLKDAEKQEKVLAEKLTGAVQKMVPELGLTTKKDMEEISKRLDKIEKRLAKAEKKETTE